MDLKKIVFVVGPTAVGKTQAAFLLAKKINGEIISCDAMQVYREVSILSNKPPAVILKAVPHHLVGIVSIARNFDVAMYRKKALAAIKEIHKKNKTPIVTGGSGLYMAVLLDGIFEGPKKDEVLRRSLFDEAKKKGSGHLYQRLMQVDACAAAAIHPNDTKRIVRALEVFALSGKPISQLQQKREGLWGKFDITIFALNRDRQEIYEIINKRVDHMFNHGALEEIRILAHKKWSPTARSIIGVGEIMGFLNGEHGLEQAKDFVKLKTRRYAKRQLTWFRHDERLRWIMINRDDTASKVAARICKEGGL